MKFHVLCAKSGDRKIYAGERENPEEREEKEGWHKGLHSFGVCLSRGNEGESCRFPLHKPFQSFDYAVLPLFFCELYRNKSQGVGG